MANSQTLTPQDFEKLADLCEAHARANHYNGPPHSSGDIYSGWPLTALVDTVLGLNASFSLKATILRTIKSRYARMAIPLGSMDPAAVGGLQTPPVYPSNLQMLAMRLRVPEGANIGGFEHLDVHQVGDKVHLWIITKDGQSTVLEDDAALWPSDAIITKLNMLKG